MLFFTVNVILCHSQLENRGKEIPFLVFHVTVEYSCILKGLFVLRKKGQCIQTGRKPQAVISKDLCVQKHISYNQGLHIIIYFF